MPRISPCACDGSEPGAVATGLHCELLISEYGLADLVRSLLLIVLIGGQLSCVPLHSGSRSSSGRWDPSQPASDAALSSSPEPSLIETPVETERKATIEQARLLLDDGRFSELESLAGRLLADTSILPNGFRKLDSFFVAFKDLPRNTPDSLWRSRISKAEQWVAERPQSTVANLVLAETWTAYAWVARGSGPASSVSNEGWEQFRARLARAHAYLDAARKCPEKSPRYGLTAARIDLGEHWDAETSRASFDEAVASYPTVSAYYFARAWYLQPRWNGGPGEWEAFASMAADRLTGSEGDVLYARIVWHLDTVGVENVFRESKADWPRVQRGFLILLQQYPEELTVMTKFAKLGALAGDRQQAQEMFQRISNRVDSSVWSKEQFKSCRAWAFAS